MKKYNSEKKIRYMNMYVADTWTTIDLDNWLNSENPFQPFLKKVEGETKDVN